MKPWPADISRWIKKEEDAEVWKEEEEEEDKLTKFFPLPPSLTGWLFRPPGEKETFMKSSDYRGSSFPCGVWTELKHILPGVGSRDTLDSQGEKMEQSFSPTP